LFGLYPGQQPLIEFLPRFNTPARSLLIIKNRIEKKQWLDEPPAAPPCTLKKKPPVIL